MSSPGGGAAADLFYEDLIAGYATDPNAVSRDWLSSEIRRRLAKPDCRFVLITGEPGSGKTGAMAALAHGNATWLRYFIRADSVRPLSGVDAVSLLLRVGHQLAHSEPQLFDPKLMEIVVEQRIGNVAQGANATGVRIDDLTASPFYRTAIRVSQNVEALSGGLIGVEIARANIEPRLLQLDTLGSLALFDPALVLARENPGQTIVVLIDGLDEAIDTRQAGGILDWLETFPEPPPNLRFVLSSRPHSRLRTLQSVRGASLETLAIESFAQDVERDAHNYASKLFDVMGVFAGEPPPKSAAAAAALTKAAKGNFAYLTAYARSLRSAIETKNQPMLNELLEFEALPEGLLPLYAAFVRRLRRQVENLGRLEVEGSSARETDAVPAWEGAGQNFLSVLAVAFAPLTLDQLVSLGLVRVWKSAASNVFQAFVPFLDRDGAGWRLFHPSLGEFLTAATGDDLSDIAVDAREWDTRIVRHYKGPGEWDDVDWRKIDDYGLLYCARHLARASGDPPSVASLLTSSLRRAMRTRFRTDLPFRNVAEQVRLDPKGEMAIGTLLPHAVFLELVLGGLRAGAKEHDPAVLGLMARLGRVDEALERAEVLAPGLRKYRSLEAIVACTPDPRREQLGPKDGVERLVAAAIEVPRQSERLLFPGIDRDECLRSAALAMAVHDLEKALEIVSGCEASDGSEFDDVLAAGLRAAPARAEEILGKMKSGRSAAALELAERGAAGREAMIAIARAHLDDETDAKRWPLQARILALRAVKGSEEARSLEAELLAVARDFVDADESKETDLDEASPDKGTKEVFGWRDAIVDVAAHVHAFEPQMAERLLAVCEPKEATFASAGPLLSAAKQWTAWGRPNDARRVLEKALAHYRGYGWYGPARDIAGAAVVASKIDASWGHELALEAVAMVDPQVLKADEYEEGRLDGILSGMVDVLRDWDRSLALKVARWLQGAWVPGAPWNMASGRGTALALIALDAEAEDRDVAANLFQECLGDDEGAVRLGRSDPTVPDYGLFCPPSELPAGEDQMRRENFESFVRNQMNYWIPGRKWRFFVDPADVLRSMEYVYSPGHSWARAVATAIAPIAVADLDRAFTLTSWLADPAERLVGLAALARALSDAGDPRASLTIDAIKSAAPILPVYVSQLDLDRVPQREILVFLNPSVRARFESAMHLIAVDSTFAQMLAMDTSRYIQGVVYAQTVFEWLGGSAAPLTSDVDEAVKNVADFGDDVLVDLVKFAGVIAESHGDRAAARNLAASISGTALRAAAQIRCADGKNVAEQCLKILQALDSSVPEHCRAEVAGIAIGVCNARGEPSSAIFDQTLAAVRLADPLPLARGLMALARHANKPERSEFLTSAVQGAGQIDNPYLQGDAMADLFAVAVALDENALALALIPKLFESGWIFLMDALGRAMPSLVTRSGPAIVEILDATMRRAQSVLGAAYRDDERPVHLDGVIAPHLRAADPVRDVLTANQLDPEFAGTFLDAEDLPPTFRCVQDSRGQGADRDDEAFRRLHGRYSGMAIWMDEPDQPIFRMCDIRFLFDNAEDAAAYHRERLSHNSEGRPAVADAPSVGEECSVFGGSDTVRSGDMTITMTGYFYIFRVGNVVVKLFAAQGHQSATRLTPGHLFVFAQKIAEKISTRPGPGTRPG